MTYCEVCGGWLSGDKAWHDAAVRDATHLRQDHGFSRRFVARRVGVREKFVRDHAEQR